MPYSFDVPRLPARYIPTGTSEMYTRYVATNLSLREVIDARWKSLQEQPDVATAAGFLLVASAVTERAEATRAYPDLTAELGWRAEREERQAATAVRRAREAFDKDGVGHLGKTVSGLLLGGEHRCPEPARTRLAADILSDRRSDLALVDLSGRARREYAEAMRLDAARGVVNLVNRKLGEHFAGNMGPGRRRQFIQAKSTWPLIAYGETLRALGTAGTPVPVTLLRMQRVLNAAKAVKRLEDPSVPNQVRDLVDFVEDVLTPGRRHRFAKS